MNTEDNDFHIDTGEAESLIVRQYGRYDGDCDFRTLKVGISLVFWASIAFAAVTVLELMLLLLVLGFGLSLPVVVFPLLVLVRSLAGLLNIGGTLTCLNVPREVGATGLIWAAATLLVLNTGIGLVKQFQSDLLPFKLLLMSQLAPVVGAVLFILFLRRLASFIHARNLVDEANGVLIYWAIAIAVIILGVLAAFTLRIDSRLLLIIGVVVAIAAFIRYLLLLTGLQKRL